MKHAYRGRFAPRSHEGIDILDGEAPVDLSPIETSQGGGVASEVEEGRFAELFDRLIAHLDVYSALEKLRVKQREVIELLFFDGLTQDEAASRLGIDVTNVQRRLYRSLSTLREIFQIS